MDHLAGIELARTSVSTALKRAEHVPGLYSVVMNLVKSCIAVSKSTSTIAEVSIEHYKQTVRMESSSL